MPKITLGDLSNILGNPASAANTVNNNNTILEQASDNTLSRDGTAPNHMLADFDMNHNDILNVKQLEADSILLDGSLIVTDGLESIPPGSITEDLIADGAITGDKLDIESVRDTLKLVQGPIHSPHFSPMVVDYGFQNGFNVCLFPRIDGGLTIVSRQGPTHGNNDDAEIVAWETYDKGTSSINNRIIYRGSATDDRNFASIPMANNRWTFVALRNQGGTYIEPTFNYSDDQGLTWTTTAFTLDPGLPVGFASSPHGKIMPYPASAGGHDTLGWIVYFYSSSRIAFSTTVDNGTTWSPVTQCINSPTLNPNEMAVGRVGLENKWFMIMRGSPNNQAIISTSTNMTTWTTPTLTNIPLGGNPPYIVTDSEATWLYTSNRKRADRIFTKPQNSIVVTKINASEFYNSVGLSGFDDWRVVAQLTQWGVGYMDFIEYDGEWICAINSGELPIENSVSGGGANALYMLSNRSATDALVLLKGAHQHQSKLLNSYMQVWQNGTSATGTAARMMTADGWGLRRNSSATGHEWSRVNNVEGDYSLQFGRIAGNTSVTPINLVNVMNIEDVRALRGTWCNFSLRAKGGANFSAVGGSVTVNVYSNVTESQITSTDGTVPGSVSLVSFNLILDQLGRWTDIDEPILIPKDSQMVWVRIIWTPVGTAGANDNVILKQAVIVGTPYKQPTNPRSYGEELAQCQRYFVKTYDSTVAPGAITTAGALQQRARGTEASGSLTMNWRFPVEMRASPTITVYSPVTGAAGQISNSSAGVDIAGSVESLGRSGATIINTVATVSGNNYRAHAVASALPW